MRFYVKPFNGGSIPHDFVLDETFVSVFAAKLAISYLPYLKEVAGGIEIHDVLIKCIETSPQVPDYTFNFVTFLNEFPSYGFDPEVITIDGWPGFHKLMMGMMNGQTFYTFRDAEEIYQTFKTMEVEEDTSTPFYTSEKLAKLFSPNSFVYYSTLFDKKETVSFELFVELHRKNLMRDYREKFFSLLNIFCHADGVECAVFCEA